MTVDDVTLVLAVICYLTIAYISLDFTIGYTGRVC